ncbi:MAG TPA: hypothetical protein VF228_13205 [Iamia sp.]
MPADLVWYVAYGSNMAADRLRAYLEGADDAGELGARFGVHRGCTDATPPRADRALTLDRAVTYRGRSQRWSGGVAFLDLHPTPGTATPARAWLLGVDQVAELAAQEGRLAVAPAAEALAAIPPDGTLGLGGGWYDTILRLPDVDGRPALAITTAQDLPEAAPTPAYLATIAAGRDEIRAMPQPRRRPGSGPSRPG